MKTAFFNGAHYPPLNWIMRSDTTSQLCRGIQMSVLATLGSIAQIGSALAGPIMQGIGLYQNEKNFQQQSELLEYQKALQERIFEREDTAFQRHLKDVNAAGFSPLAALGSSSGAGQAVSMSAPQRDIGAYVQMAAAQNQLAQGLAERQYLRAQTKFVEAETAEKNHNLKYYSGLGLPTNSSMTERFVGDALKILGTNFENLSSDIRQTLKGAQNWFSRHSSNPFGTVNEASIVQNEKGLENSLNSGSVKDVPTLVYSSNMSLADKRKTWQQAYDDMYYMFGDLSHRDKFERWLKNNPFPEK